VKSRFSLLIAALLLFALILFGCSSSPENEAADNNALNTLDEKGSYTSTEDVAEYLHIYGKLPSNYITKNEALKLGWDSDKGNLWDVTDKKSIGGDSFGNREGKLPKGDGRRWFECDVNYGGGFRGGERIVYSNDGLIFFTDDHYNTFKRLY
jgi:guanyl-specific ribonuclease Sa